MKPIFHICIILLTFPHREFDLKLVPDHSIFSPDFKAVLQRDDKEIEIDLDKDSFMKGYVEGNLLSSK